jgi:SAM-dependent methyltransferase
LPHNLRLKNILSAFMGVARRIGIEHKPEKLGAAGSESEIVGASDTRRAPTSDHAEASYQAKMQQEISRYADVKNVHDLPPIFHFWSNKYLLPMCQDCGFSGIDNFFAKYLLEAVRCSENPVPRIISIGAGNCDLEIRVAKLLKESGLNLFSFECLELNQHMLGRGKEQSLSEGVAEHMTFTECDFNAWKPTGIYAGIMANHSLHHVVNLEGLLDNVLFSLESTGKFVVSDMIGRNGHQRWPEALEILERFWQELPDSYRYHHLLKRHEPSYINWDCSSEGFEGIRAQDILPLLVERFDFQLFMGFANVIGPLIDRGFGHNFDTNAEWDRDFIDRVHAADEDGFRSGILKPTQMLAVMTPVPSTNHLYSRGISPKMAVRRPD